MNKLSEAASKIELGVKTCSRCKIEKAVSEFSNKKSSKDGKSYRCKSCDAFYFANESEKTREKRKNRVQSGRYKDYYSEYRKEHKDSSKKYHKEYRLLNKHKRNSSNAKRHSIKLLATPPWLTKEHFLEIESIYSHARDCQIVTGESYHVDHIIPLQGKNVCGLHVPWNLQVLPAAVNIRKSNRYEQT